MIKSSIFRSSKPGFFSRRAMNGNENRATWFVSIRSDKHPSKVIRDHLAKLLGNVCFHAGGACGRLTKTYHQTNQSIG